MLDKTNTEIRSSLERIKRTKDGEVLIDWLQKSLRLTENNSVRIKDEVLTRWEQGAAQLLQDLIKQIYKEE